MLATPHAKLVGALSGCLRLVYVSVARSSTGKGMTIVWIQALVAEYVTRATVFTSMPSWVMIRLGVNLHCYRKTLNVSGFGKSRRTLRVGDLHCQIAAGMRSLLDEYDIGASRLAIHSGWPSHSDSNVFWLRA